MQRQQCQQSGTNGTNNEKKWVKERLIQCKQGGGGVYKELSATLSFMSEIQF